MNLFSIFVICFLTQLSAHLAFAASDANINDPVEQAIFAQTIQTENITNTEQKKIGLTVEGSSGMGLIYSQQIQPNRNLWSKFSFMPSQAIMFEKYEDSLDVAYVQANEKKRFQFMIGLDQIFRPTQNKYWGIILGASIGANYSEYSSKYHRQLCSYSICGFDPNNPIEKNETDTYSFLASKIGVGFFETQVWGLKGDFKIALHPMMGRTGEFYFSSPSGRRFNAAETTPYSLEATVRF